MTTKLRGATVRRYLERARDTTAISGATEHTYRAPLIDFMKEAAAELGFGAIDVHSELRLASVGQPDLQLTGVGVGASLVDTDVSRTCLPGRRSCVDRRQFDHAGCPISSRGLEDRFSCVAAREAAVDRRSTRFHGLAGRLDVDAGHPVTGWIPGDLVD